MLLSFEAQVYPVPHRPGRFLFRCRNGGKNENKMITDKPPIVDKTAEKFSELIGGLLLLFIEVMICYLFYSCF